MTGAVVVAVRVLAALPQPVGHAVAGAAATGAPAVAALGRGGHQYRRDAQQRERRPRRPSDCPVSCHCNPKVCVLVISAKTAEMAGRLHPMITYRHAPAPSPLGTVTLWYLPPRLGTVCASGTVMPRGCPASGQANTPRPLARRSGRGGRGLSGVRPAGVRTDRA
ncbi:hypothetical protein GCM10020295_07350 [Streptomyces cinereospinus]